MDDIARQPPRDRADLFTEAGARRGLAAAILEKDFWVCWALKRLFALPGENPSLVFKGGTSLSKVYRAINRFSEDIDLSFDRRDLGFVDDRDPQSALTGKKRGRLLDELSAAVETHIEEALMPQLGNAIGAELRTARGDGWDLTTDSLDPQTVVFRYPVSFAGRTYAALSYVNPIVKLELGARGEPWPTERHTIIPYAAEEFRDSFGAPSCDVTVLAVERTFWEKATLLHAEYHRPIDKPTDGRLSRHYYDLALLADTEYCGRALARLDLLEHVAQHKATFFAAAWARYDSARAGSLRLVPPTGRLSALDADYKKMAPMIFADPPRFGDLIDRITELERRINAT